MDKLPDMKQNDYEPINTQQTISDIADGDGPPPYKKTHQLAFAF